MKGVQHQSKGNEDAGACRYLMVGVVLFRKSQ